MLQSNKKLRRGEALPRKVCSLLLHKSKIRGESNGAHKSDCDGSRENPEGFESPSRSARIFALFAPNGRDRCGPDYRRRSNLLAAIFRCIALPAGRYGGKSLLVDALRIASGRRWPTRCISISPTSAIRTFVFVGSLTLLALNA